MYRIHIICVVLIVILLGSSACTTKKKPLTLQVKQYYDSNGPVINVGKYSDSLTTTDLTKLRAAVTRMREELSNLRPEQMFVVAIRLYNLGERDEALYWFYEAQYRARLYHFSIDKRRLGESNSGVPDLTMDYVEFYDKTQRVFHAYAECDYNKWEKLAMIVRDNNKKVLDLIRIFPGTPFVGRDEMQEINDRIVAVGIKNLLIHIRKKKLKANGKGSGSAVCKSPAS